MRCLLLSLSFLSLGFLACNKNTTSETDIFRQWKWENSTGGFAGFLIQPSIDSSVSLALKSDMTYCTRLNGQVVAQGSFQILTVNNQRVIQIKDFTQTQGLVLYKECLIQVENNKLHLTDYQISEPYTHNFD